MGNTLKKFEERLYIIEKRLSFIENQTQLFPDMKERQKTKSILRNQTKAHLWGSEESSPLMDYLDFLDKEPHSKYYSHGGLPSAPPERKRMAVRFDQQGQPIPPVRGQSMLARQGKPR